MKKVLAMIVMLMFVLAACGEESVDDVLDDNQDVLDNEVTIIFDSNGGSEVDDVVFSLDNPPASLEEPTREGYTFSGWFLDESFVEAFNVNALDDIDTVTVYAQWQAETNDDDDDDDDPVNTNELTINFDSQGGSSVDDLVVNLTNLPTSLPEPTRDGFEFLGWYLDDGFEDTFDLSDISAIDNVTVYARWIELFDVTFNSDGTVIDTQSIRDGNTPSPVTEPTKTGYSFSGWYYDAQFTESLAFDESDPVTEDLEIYAKFVPNTYTITFDAGEYTVDPITFDYGSQAALPALDNIESFYGWYLEDSFETMVDGSNLPASDITLYGFFLPVYNVAYYVDGTLIEEDTMLAGETITFPEDDPSKEGYTFLGWQQFSDDYTFNYLMNEGAMIIMDTNLEAVFEPIEYTVSFADPLLDPMTIPFGEPLDIEDYDDPLFIGWYLDDAFTMPLDYDTMPANDITLYANIADSNDILSLDTVLTYTLSSARIQADVIHYEYLDIEDQHLYILNDGNAQVVVILETALTEMVEGKHIDAVIDINYDDGAIGYSISAVTVLDDMTTRVPTEITLTDLASLDLTDLATQATIYTVEGFVMTEGGSAILFDTTNNAFYPFINIMLSTNYDNLLNGLAHNYVSFAFTIMEIEGEQVLIYLDDVQTMTSVTLTDVEKLTVLSDFLDAIYETESFMVGDDLDIPDVDPFFGSTVTASVVGDNASYYDAVNDTFLYTDSDRLIDLEITLTLGNETVTITTSVTLEAVMPDPLDDVFADAYYTLEGTVFYRNDTHILFGDNNTLLWLFTDDALNYTVGNTYTLTAFTYLDGPIINGSVDTVLNNGGISQSVLTPTPLTLAALAQLEDVHNSLYHTLEGVILSSDNLDYPYILSDGVNTIYLPDHADIQNALGEKVAIDVFINDYYMDQETGGYIGYYSDTVHTLTVLQFDILAQMDFAELLLQPYLQSVYRPNKTYTFPLNFDDLGLPITYTLIGGQAANVSMVENGDLELTFTDAGIYNINIHIYVGNLNRQITQAFIVEDYTISTINDAINNTPGSVHTFELRVDGFSREHDTILTDGTGTVLVSETIFTTYYPLGETMIVTGSLVQENGVYYIANAVLEELTTTTISLTQPQLVTFGDLDLMNEPYGDILHIEIEGVLDFPPEGSDMALIDSGGSYYLLGRDPSDSSWFNNLGETVLLRGYFMYSEDFGVNIIAISEVTVVPN